MRNRHGTGEMVKNMGTNLTTIVENLNKVAEAQGISSWCFGESGGMDPYQNSYRIPIYT